MTTAGIIGSSRNFSSSVLTCADSEPRGRKALGRCPRRRRAFRPAGRVRRPGSARRRGRAIWRAGRRAQPVARWSSARMSSLLRVWAVRAWPVHDRLGAHVGPHHGATVCRPAVAFGMCVRDVVPLRYGRELPLPAVRRGTVLVRAGPPYAPRPLLDLAHHLLHRVDRRASAHSSGQPLSSTVRRCNSTLSSRSCAYFGGQLLVLLLAGGQHPGPPGGGDLPHDHDQKTEDRPRRRRRPPPPVRCRSSPVAPSLGFSLAVSLASIVRAASATVSGVSW